jgi:predicted lipoprotein with Yx(FWY)xxD motif
MLFRALVSCALLLATTSLVAQPADLPIPAATTERFPAGVRTKATAAGLFYTNRRRQILYGLDMRTVMRAGPNAAQYCQGACLETWAPLLAPKSALPNIEFPQGLSFDPDPRPEFFKPQKAPDWTIIVGPQGPQYVYKGWHMVFTKRDAKADEPAPDALDGRTWNTLKYVPPVPQITAPPGVKPLFHGGRYVLADKDGRLLFTGQCTGDCAGWQPFVGGAASAGVADWNIGQSGDMPQWLYKGQPVFMAPADHPLGLPAGAKAVQP